MVKVVVWTSRRFGVQHHRQSVAMKGKVGFPTITDLIYKYCGTEIGTLVLFGASSYQLHHRGQSTCKKNNIPVNTCGINLHGDFFFLKQAKSTIFISVENFAFSTEVGSRIVKASIGWNYLVVVTASSGLIYRFVHRARKKVVRCDEFGIVTHF